LGKNKFKYFFIHSIAFELMIRERCTMEKGARDDRELVRWAFEGRRRIALELLHESGPPLSFKELVSGTGIRPTVLAYHLGLLSREGLISRSLCERHGRRDYTAYSLTEEGRSLLSLRERIEEDDRRRRQVIGDRVPESIYVVHWRNLPRCFLIWEGRR